MIAVELARDGFFVYATGRSSRTSGPSELDRPETIEETGELSVQPRLIALDDQQMVSAAPGQVGGVLPLGMQSISGNNRASDVNAVQRRHGPSGAIGRSGQPS